MRRITRPFAFSVILCVLSLLAANSPASGWTTYRGNPQRTGNSDEKAGPTTPKVLWVLPTTEHFIASPVPHGDRLYLPGLGAFNVSTFYCLDTTPDAKERKVWTKSSPLLKLPIVSSPVLFDGKVVFGDGMHQTDGAVLHCLKAADGLPQWQFQAPGQLVHLESAPVIADKRALAGGGNLGVVCLDLEKLTLDGKERTPKEIQTILEDKWKEMVAQYEKDKLKCKDFAIPPSEDKLPKPSPVKLWQQGEQKWHVDAPLNVVGDKVLVASAFLDKEKVGDRALHCLDLKTGTPIWRAPLTINPWGGASVQDKTVIVTGSTIGYDTKSLKGAKGEVAAFNLDDGKPLWPNAKEVPGGVVSCAALANGLAIVTATDGKVRAFTLDKGDRKWIYDAKSPLFAAPAVVGGVAYVGDLQGVVHAIDLANGTAKWKLDLGTDPAVKAPGMIFGGPVVHNGRVFVATYNNEGPNANKPTVIVCIGEGK